MSTDHALEDQPLGNSTETSNVRDAEMDSNSVKDIALNDSAATLSAKKTRSENEEDELTDITTNSFELEPRKVDESQLTNDIGGHILDPNRETSDEQINSQNEELNKELDEHLIKSAPVEINILGKVYTINCPVGEEAELSSATDYINDFIQSIRDQAPLLSYEHLLVLCSLNLYEKTQQAKHLALSKEEDFKDANTLVEKMIEDMTINKE